jgi:WD40 repeat protein
MEQGNAVYIPPQAKAGLQASDESRFQLMEKVKEFLNTEQRVFLLLGDPGAGKSTFSRALDRELWNAYKKDGDIPLLVNLPAIDKPEYNLVAKQLRKLELTEPQIRELKMHRRFILICDGYDEGQQTHNLYTSNLLNEPGEWSAKMIISCRTEYLGVDYRDRFQPGDRNQHSKSAQFQEAVMTPFTEGQIEGYINEYVSIHQPLWEANDYKQALDLIPSLKELVRNPFMMTLTLEVMPRMMDPGEHLSSTQFTMVDLYDHFIEHWLERGKKRLGEKKMNPQSKAAYESMIDEGFTQNGIDFLKKLSIAIYKEQDGQPIVEYSRYKDEHSWKSEFFGRDDEKQLLREACPLTRNGNQYRFIHRSFLEYGLALSIFDRGTAQQGAIDTDEEPSTGSPLAWRNFVDEHSVLQFLVERARQEPVFKQQLLGFIELSKTDKKWRTAAANAITILVKAGVKFYSADLKGIQIPGADLSYGMFDSAQLQEADLENVNLCGVWLRQADLTNAHMSGVYFGELPSLSHDGMVLSCAYSPDGESLAVSLEDGDISVYSTSGWEEVQTLKGHNKTVWRVVYSPQGSQIASASSDMTVRLWDVGSGTYQHTLIGHTDGVKCVTFSPQGDQVASASDDKTVRFWDVATGDCHQTLSGHNAGVSCVTYSPRGDLLASGSMDSTVRLWDVGSGDCRYILSGHNDEVSDVSYSPQDGQFASASHDRTIRIWDVETGVCRRVLSGHNSSVCSVTYSPNGRQVASGSEDGTVRLWDVEARVCHRIKAHSSGVFSVVYSPEGNLVASGSGDKTVRLWDIPVETSRPASSRHAEDVLCIKYSPKGGEIVSRSTESILFLDMMTRVMHREFRGHSGTVTSAVYSPHGNQMASGGTDKTVRLWNMGTGECQHMLTGHSDWVNCIAYSPQRNQLASASNDTTVRLWDTETGSCLSTLFGHSEAIFCVVYSPNGSQIASCSADDTVRLWSIRTGVCNHVLSGHSDKVCNAVYSPQGHQLASASHDKTVRVWDVQAGECYKILTGHDSKVTGVRYSPESDMVASVSLDGTIRLWCVESGQSLAVIQTFQDNIFDIAWSATPEGNYLTTGCRNGSLVMWRTAREGKVCHAGFRWGSMDEFPLTLANATIQDVRGLSELNKRLLEQHGAEGTPAPLAPSRQDKSLRR